MPRKPDQQRVFLLTLTSLVFAAGCNGCHDPPNPDTTPPGLVTGLVVAPGDATIDLQWVAPADSDLAGVMIRRATGASPATKADGTEICALCTSPISDNGLTNGTEYFYSAFAYDTTGNYSSPDSDSGIPLDMTPPGPVTLESFTPGNQLVTISWSEPSDSDLAGILVLRKSTNTISGPNDPGATSVCGSCPGEAATDLSLTNDTTYYYGIYAFDADSNYSTGVFGQATPSGVWGVTTAQEAYIKASNTDSTDGFGYSIAVDGNTMAVGAYREASNATGVGGDDTDNSTTDSGAVYVFLRSGSTWTQQAYIKASNTEASDQFGWSVALSGDTLAVGAPPEDSAATGIGGNEADNTAANAGAVYVFTRVGSIWAQQAYVKASNAGASDNFGYSVSIDGDTLAVGARTEASAATTIGGNEADNTALNAGAVYVFTRSAALWTQEAYVKASNTNAGDAFGHWVSLSGDTLAVSAPFEDSNETGTSGIGADDSAVSAGAAYVFTRSGSTWTQEAYIKASNTEANDQFGFGLSLSGDTLAVGARYEDSIETGTTGTGGDNSALNAGAAYVFTRTGTVWTQEAYIKASNPDAGDIFGYQLSLYGDTLAVGAFVEASNEMGLGGLGTDNSASGSGAAYLLTRTGSVWSQQAYIKASNTDSGDGFGWSLALSGSLLAIGAVNEASSATGIAGDQLDNLAANAGAVYVFAK